jgi:hypothetical protein
MQRFEPLLCLVATVLAVLIGGCSLLVDFDQSLLVDAAVDASLDGGVDAETDAN